MDTLGCIQAWLIWQEQQEQSEVPEIQISSIPGLLILILILTPLIDLHPVLAAQLLARGSRGQGVVELQDNLKQAGCMPGSVRSTGYYGKITKAAVQKLQRTHGLRVDGVVGEQTRNALDSGKTCQSLASSGVLKMGSRGENVRQLQVQLNNWGFPVKKVDGVFGKETRVAVIRFQNYHGLKPDGIVGPKTAKVLWTPRSQVSQISSVRSDNTAQKNRISSQDIINLPNTAVQALKPKEFKALEEALDSSDKQIRYSAAFKLATEFDNQSVFRCVGVDKADYNPCDPNVITLVISSSNEEDDSKIPQYKEVKLPVEKMLTIFDDAIEKENDPFLQFSAAVARTWIYQPPTKQVIEILKLNLENKDEIIAKEALNSLEQIASNSQYVQELTADTTVQALITLFKRQPDLGSFTTLSYLAATGNTKALQALDNFLTNPSDGYFASIFASILGKEKGQTVFNTLNSVIENKELETQIRSSATEAIGQIHFTEENVSLKSQVIDTLQKALEDSDEDTEVRFAAAVALAQIGLPKDSPIKSTVVETLNTVLQNTDEDEAVRGKATEALAKVGGKEALGILKDVLNNMNETEDVRSAAAGALAEIGGEQKEEAKTFLKKALNNSKTPDPVRINVALAVSKFDLNSALSALTKMYDKDPKIGAVDSPAVALVYIGQEKPDRVVESLQQLSKKYKNTGRQKRSMETDKIIEYIKNPSLNIYFDPRGGCCDGTKESRDAFIKEAKKRLSSSRTKQKR